jgi:hypothetical protein
MTYRGTVLSPIRSVPAPQDATWGASYCRRLPHLLVILQPGQVAGGDLGPRMVGP